MVVSNQVDFMLLSSISLFKTDYLHILSNYPKFLFLEKYKLMCFNFYTDISDIQIKEIKYITSQIFKFDWN